MARTAAKVDVFAGRAVVVMAVAATEMVDGLAGKGFGGKSGAGYNDLAMFVLKSGGCGLESGHFLKGTACFVSQAVSSSSLREPSAKWRKVRYFSSGVETTAKPFRRRKPSETTSAVRLLPSTDA